MYNELAQSFGGTMATGYVLLSIDAKGTPSTALGPKMGMEATSLSRTLKVLQERQLIERSKHPSDGRIILIHLTDEGKKMREYARNAVIDFNSRMQQIVLHPTCRHFSAWPRQSPISLPRKTISKKL